MDIYIYMNAASFCHTWFHLPNTSTKLSTKLHNRLFPLSVWCSVAMWCGVVQYGAMCCSVVQCVAVWCSALVSMSHLWGGNDEEASSHIRPLFQKTPSN